MKNKKNHPPQSLPYSSTCYSNRLSCLEAISHLLKQDHNLKNILPNLLNIFLKISYCDVGSIQLKNKTATLNNYHINFPEKILNSFLFKQSETLSDHAKKTKEILILEPYNYKQQKFSQTNRIIVESYISIPILHKGDCIAIIDLARKFNKNQHFLSDDDVLTLKEMASISGSIIHNSLAYENTLKLIKKEQELAFAIDIQSKVLPKSTPTISNFNFGALNVTSKEVDSDYYDIFKLDKNRIVIILANIVGKGIESSITMAILKSILAPHIHHCSSPKECLKKINNIIYNDPIISTFIPLFFGILDNKKMILTYTNAGHEPALIIRKSKTIALETTGFPLGGIKDETFEEKKIPLIEGDTISFHSDRLVEMQNLQKQFFGTKRLATLMRKYNDHSPDEVVNKIYAHINKFTLNTPNKEDLILLICKVGSVIPKKNQSKLLLKKNINISSKLSEIKVLRNKIVDICKESHIDDEITTDIKLSINEVHANIIQHAYFGDENKEIVCKFLLYNDKIEVIMRDYGMSSQGGISTYKDIDIDGLQGSGLGVYLYSTLMDHVEYKSHKIGSETKLTKFIKKKEGVR